MKRAYLLVVLITGLVFGAGATTWAAPPEQGTAFFSFDCCQSFGGFCPLNCGTELEPFLICETADIDIKYKYFFNKDGETIRYWEHNKLIGGWYEVNDPDNFLPYIPLSLTYKFDYITLEEVYTGVFALITVPGYGQIFKDVGRIAWDGDGEVIFEAGEHQYFNDDTEALCNYMMND